MAATSAFVADASPAAVEIPARIGLGGADNPLRLIDLVATVHSGVRVDIGDGHLF